jgi:hypothetical protein
VVSLSASRPVANINGNAAPFCVSTIKCRLRLSNKFSLIISRTDTADKSSGPGLWLGKHWVTKVSSVCARRSGFPPKFRETASRNVRRVRPLLLLWDIRVLSSLSRL